MRAYIQQIDITDSKKVVVSGQLSSTNLQASLSEHIYVVEPEDGIWGYTLYVTPTSTIGADMLVPFSVEAPWTGNEGASGIRVIQPTLNPTQPDYEIIQLTVKKVEKFTTAQANHLMVDGAAFDKSTNQLVIDARYGGGCFPHKFLLEWDGITIKTEPPQYYFNLVDISEYDPCKAIIPVQVRFDIDNLEFQIARPSLIHLRSPRSARLITIKTD